DLVEAAGDQVDVAEVDQRGGEGDRVRTFLGERDRLLAVRDGIRVGVPLGVDQRQVLQGDRLPGRVEACRFAGEHHAQVFCGVPVLPIAVERGGQAVVGVGGCGGICQPLRCGQRRAVGGQQVVGVTVVVKEPPGRRGQV